MPPCGSSLPWRYILLVMLLAPGIHACLMTMCVFTTTNHVHLMIKRAICFVTTPAALGF